MVGLGTGHSEPFFHFDSKLVLFERVRRDFALFFYLRQTERKTERSQESVDRRTPLPSGEMDRNWIRKSVTFFV